MEHLKVEKMAMQVVSSEQKMIGYGEVIFFWFLVWLFGIQYHYGKLLPNVKPRVFWYSLLIISGVTSYYLYPLLESLFLQI